MNYKALHLFTDSPEKRDFLVGWLSAKGFSGFEEKDDRITAFIAETEFPQNSELFDQLRAEKLPFQVETVEDANWNAIWENSFSPVQIGRFCAVRAAFHQPVKDVRHEIIITPRMTFGTGHHSTTASMIRLMEGLDLKGKTILDFGTGTGILAILAARMGAARVLAADHDANAVDNARQNALENRTKQIIFVHADKPDIEWGTFDVILVNIHLQVILSYLKTLVAALNQGGRMLLSGVLEHDFPVLEKALTGNQCRAENLLNENGWIAGAWHKT